MIFPHPPGLRQDGYGVRGDRLDLLRRALELLVGEHGRALEWEVAVQLEPRAAAEVLVTDLHGHGPRDAVGAQEDHVERVAALPGEPLLRVVGRPHVVRRQRVDAARVRDQVGRGHLRPCADPHAVGLRNPTGRVEVRRQRLTVRPHALLERATELRAVRRAHQVALLMVEGGVEEEAVVLDLEMPILFADAALPEGHELLALRESTYGHSPFFEGGRHTREKTRWSSPRRAKTPLQERGTPHSTYRPLDCKWVRVAAAAA